MRRVKGNGRRRASEKAFGVAKAPSIERPALIDAFAILTPDPFYRDSNSENIYNCIYSIVGGHFYGTD